MKFIFSSSDSVSGSFNSEKKSLLSIKTSSGKNSRNVLFLSSTSFPKNISDWLSSSAVIGTPSMIDNYGRLNIVCIR